MATCGEKLEYREYGIQPNHCVDDNLMVRFSWQDEVLMKFLGIEIRSKKATQSLFGEPEEIPENAIILDDNIHYGIK